MPTVNFYNSELMAQQSSDPLWLNMVRIGPEVPTMPRTSFTTSIYYFAHFNFQANMTSWCMTFYLWPLKFISNAVFKDSKLFLCFSFHICRHNIISQKKKKDDILSWISDVGASIYVSLLSAAAISVSIFKSETNPVLYEDCLSMLVDGNALGRTK